MTSGYVLNKVFVVFEMVLAILRTVGDTGIKLLEVVERHVMGLKIDRSNKSADVIRILPTVNQGFIPTTCIPSPIHAFRRQLITNGFGSLCGQDLSFLRIRIVEITWRSRS